MDRELKIKAVSFKSRGILVDKTWLRASKDLELKTIKVGQIQKLRISETLDGQYIVHGVIE